MKKSHVAPAFCLSFALLAAQFAFAQQPAQPTSTLLQTQSVSSSQTATQQSASEDEVVRITSNLVQIDAIVTDKHGNQVKNLTADDFEIYQDGKPQTITNFSYVNTVNPSANITASVNTPTKSVDKLAPPVPPARVRPEQVRRTIALVVDDLGLSFESTAYVRQSLKKFVDTQTQTNDLIAIVRTSAGVGALQQFTTDRQQLYAAIERVRWNPSGRGGVSAFAPIEPDPMAQANKEARAARGDDPGRNNGRASSTSDDIVSNNNAKALDEFREDLFAVGTLGALNYVVRGLKELPGRKSVVLFSEGFRLTTKNSFGPAESRQFKETDTRINDALQRLVDLALRSSVVIYTIDARGLPYTGLTAADNTSGMSRKEIQTSTDDRRDLLFETQSTLQYLATQTGGLAFRNTNDLSSGVKRALDDQQGFYLIAYRPDEKTFDSVNRRFHKWTVKVKNHPEVRVRSRKGFYGFTESEAKPLRRTRGEQLIAALSSPFGAGGINLKLTSLFSNDRKAGSFMRSLLHINARDLTFAEEPDGWRKAMIDVMAVTFGDNGTVVDEVNRTETLRVRRETYQSVLRDGLVFTINVPVKKPGAYQLRVALRDAPSEHVGAASQFVEVPDLKKNRLALSGIIISGAREALKTDKTSAAQTKNAPPTPAPVAPTDTKEGATTGNYADSEATPSLRHFRPGMTVDYAYIIFDAQIDRATKQPQLQMQLRLFRDGKLLFTGQPQPYNLSLADQSDLQHLPMAGRFQLSRNMQPGEYVLQIIVTDRLAKEKYNRATRWIDFEVVK